MEFLGVLGYEVIGIDCNRESLAIARARFPSRDIRLTRLEDFRDDRFDTVVLKDTLHHLCGEGDVRSALHHVTKLLRPNGRLIVWDPNPQWILKICRKIVGHHDHETPPEQARDLLVSAGFDVRGCDFFETIGLPLSGGYVGVRLVPNFSAVNKAVSRINVIFSGLAHRLGWEKHLCWRYLICADRYNIADFDS